MYITVQFHFKNEIIIFTFFIQNGYYDVPNVDTIDEIGQELQHNEIQIWFVYHDVGLSNDNPTARIFFITKDGELYVVCAIYDYVTNQFLSPLVVPKKEIHTKSTLIKWENTYTIFRLGSQENTITPKIPNTYVDKEINGKVILEDLDYIFQSIDEFKSDVYQYKLMVVPTDMCDESTLFKQWTSGHNQLQCWISNNGWAIIYGTTNLFIIVGNNESHPFVITPTFSFNNSDGSTSEDIDLPSLNFDQVKYLLKTKTVEYIFNQRH